MSLSLPVRTHFDERLAQAQAKEQAVAANLTAAESDYGRVKATWERKAVPDQAMDEARARRDSIQAELEGTRREVAEATVAVQQAVADLQNCTLDVPIPQATVARKFVEPNERIQTAQPVFQIMDLSRLRVAFGVPDTKLGEFRLGQTLKVLADALPGESFAGQVAKILPIVEVLLDYVLKIDFRNVMWMVIIYIMLFFAGTGGMLGVATYAGRSWSIASIILFLVMAVLTFVQRAVTGM